MCVPHRDAYRVKREVYVCTGSYVYVCTGSSGVCIPNVKKNTSTHDSTRKMSCSSFKRVAQDLNEQSRTLIFRDRENALHTTRTKNVVIPSLYKPASNVPEIAPGSRKQILFVVF